MDGEVAGFRKGTTQTAGRGQLKALLIFAWPCFALIREWWRRGYERSRPGDFVKSGVQFDSLNSRIASPAPPRSASRISEYLRDRIMPGAPARKAARTASLTLCGVHLLLFGSVGISISTPGQIKVFVPATP